jgi:hypothetical protein
VIKYYNGRYYAVVKPLSVAVFQRFNGTAVFATS